MPDYAKLVEDLKSISDEVRLKIHLGSKEVQEEWSELERRWSSFQSRAELDRSAQDLSDAVKILGGEMKDAYMRIRRAL